MLAPRQRAEALSHPNREHDPPSSPIEGLDESLLARHERLPTRQALLHTVFRTDAAGAVELPDGVSQSLTRRWLARGLVALDEPVLGVKRGRSDARIVTLEPPQLIPHGQVLAEAGQISPSPRSAPP